MNLDKDEILAKAKALLKEEIARITYTTYFENLGIESINDNKVVLIAQSKEHKDNIERRFYDILENTFQYIIKKDCELEVILKEK